MLGISAMTKLYFKAHPTATVLFDSVLVVYGGLGRNTYAFEAHSVFDIAPPKRRLSYYNQMTAKLWIKYSTRGKKSSGRIVYASTAIDAQAMVIYGGIPFPD